MNTRTESRGAARQPRFAVLGIGSPDFWRLWYVGLVIFTVRWLETVAIAVFVFQRTRSPLLVAVMTMLRLLPMGLFGVFLGAYAEKLEKRSTLIVVVTLMMLTSGTLAVLAYTGHLAIWQLAIACFVSGIGWATDNPVRRVMVGEVVGADRIGVAMSADVGASNASRMVGPSIGGLMLAGIGLDGAFLVSVLLYATAIVAALRVRYRNGASTGPTAVFERIGEGLRLVRGDRRMMGILLVTVIFNLFGWPFTSMVPVIGKVHLNLGAAGVGMLASMDGVGAFAGALLLAFFVRPAWYGRIYLIGVIAYEVWLMAFALAPEPLSAGITLALTGLFQAGFATMQATLVYLAAPPEMRSRLLGVLSVCIGVGPLGFIAIGSLADAIGAQWASVTSGMIGLLAMGLTWRYWRGVW